MQYGWIGREARHQLALFFSWSWTRGSHRCLPRDDDKKYYLAKELALQQKMKHQLRSTENLLQWSGKEGQDPNKK